MILVDSFWLLHKCKAKLDFLKTTKGVPTGMEYGFLKSCEALERELKDKVVLCWESRSFRYEVFKEYKANRSGKLDTDRISAFKSFCRQVYDNAEHEGLEADDVIASLCGREKTTIYSNDKDVLQLIDVQTVVMKSFNDKMFPWDIQEVELKIYGLRPPELPLYFAWIGDAVDNIPGSGLFKSRVAAAIIWSREGGRFVDWPAWNGKELSTIENFKPRIDLTKLRKEKIDIMPKLWDTSKMEKWFIKMEICSLKLCGKIGMYRSEEY